MCSLYLYSLQSKALSSEVLLQCLPTELAGERVLLHPHSAMYWPERHTLIIADLHLGKATHFRRHGMPVPAYVQDETLDKLSGLLLDFKPQRLLMLGDLFHSDYNPEWEDFADLVLAFSQVSFELVPGNHDRLTHHQFEKYGIAVRPEPFVDGPFSFSHHPLDEDSADGYNLAGHIHPAVRLRGSAERLRLPCFYFGESAGLLPAFGAFTGTHTIQPRKSDEVFVLTGSSVVRAY